MQESRKEGHDPRDPRNVDCNEASASEREHPHWKILIASPVFVVSSAKRPSDSRKKHDSIRFWSSGHYYKKPWSWFVVHGLTLSGQEALRPLDSQKGFSFERCGDEEFKLKPISNHFSWNQALRPWIHRHSCRPRALFSVKTQTKDTALRRACPCVRGCVLRRRLLTNLHSDAS